jgi:glycosyltransferase involved in cell wall biosynthesis
MKTSVVLPCRNGASTIAGQLRALSTQACNEPWELIVADNGSTDGTPDVVESFRPQFPNLRVIDASARRGSAFARNTAVAQAAGEFILFCDADDEVGDHWLAEMSKALYEDQFVACRFEFEKLNPRHPRARTEQLTELQRLWYPPYMLHAGGGSLGIHRRLHDQVGGFDESLPRLMDTDYCIRVQKTGVPLRFVRTTEIHVRVRTNPSAAFRQARLWAKYNALLFRRYGDGQPYPGSWRRHLLGWKSVVRRIPSLRHPWTRLDWGFKLGWQIGSMQGALRFGVDPV